MRILSSKKSIEKKREKKNRERKAALEER